MPTEIRTAYRPSGDRASDEDATRPIRPKSLSPRRNRRDGADLREGVSSAAAETSRRDSPRIGPFRLKRLLGRGGMGQVYEALQSEPVRRRVAIKIIPKARLSREMRGRFKAEQQALGRLSHPNIAQIYETGGADDGHPFFVMELVRGTQLRRYCDLQRLSLDERIDLMITLCRAVEHAHRRGILHRDLKPDNILVTEVEGRPVPKVIDFGIAKVLDSTDCSDLDADEDREADEELVGTPSYMSPELFQCPHDLDTRVDVYSLGVILHELLIAVRPFDPLQASLPALLYQAVYEDPPRIVQRWQELDPQEQLEICERRGMKPPAMARKLAGDLDWIVATALARDREQRYPTAAQLADDLERVRRDDPIAARPSTLLYQSRRFLRKRRGVVAAAGSALAILIAGLVGTSFGIVRARDAEAAAESQARRAAAAEIRIRAETRSAQQTADFLVALFQIADPDRIENADIGVEVLLRQGEQRAEELSDDPAVQAEMIRTLARIRRRLGQEDVAMELFSRADRRARAPPPSIIGDELKRAADLPGDGLREKGTSSPRRFSSLGDP